MWNYCIQIKGEREKLKTVRLRKVGAGLAEPVFAHGLLLVASYRLGNLNFSI